MAEGRFTPGPWIIDCGTVRAGKIKVAQHWPGLLSPNVADANNILIAAAPEMYTALKAFRGSLFFERNTEEVKRLTDAALAKAEGRDA